MNRQMLLLILLLLLVTLLLVIDRIWEPPPGEPMADSFVAVSTIQIEAELLPGSEEFPPEPIPVSGRISINLSATSKERDAGKVRALGFNIAMFKVPQGPLSGFPGIEPGDGLLGFSAAGNESMLDYDRGKKTLKGQIEGFVDNAFLSTLVINSGLHLPSGQNDVIETASQPATLTIEIELDRELRAHATGIHAVTGGIKGELRVKEFEFEHFVIPDYILRFLVEAFKVDIASPEVAESEGHLCIQPYNVARPPDYVAVSGTGLAFGKPGAEVQWNKADIVFDYLPLETVAFGNFWTMTSPVSQADLDLLYIPTEVEDCIEMYFIHEFIPPGYVGGGWANGGGQPTAKIVTTDANQREGVDFNLLAHELGHVIGLHHPQAEATDTMYPASTGTLMCTGPLGIDSPSVNSQENKEHLSNDLITWQFRPRLDETDCEDDSDCGECNL